MLLRRNLIFRAPDGEGGGGGGAGAGAGAGAAGAGGASGAGGDPWYKPLGLDGDVLKFVEGKNFPDAKTALSSAMEADRIARSRNVWEKPDLKDPAKVKGWAGWSELGWTPELDKYALKRPQLREGIEYDAGLEDHLRKVAHENRIPLPAAQALLDGMVGYQHELVDRLEAAGVKSQADLDAALRTEWGDKYDANKTLAGRAAQALNLKLEDGKKLDELLGAPGLVRLFATIGGMMSEDQLAGAGAGTAMSAGTARAELNRLQEDPAFMRAFTDERNPRHAEVKAQRDRLLGIIAGAKV